jgi:hypothetical protein
VSEPVELEPDEPDTDADGAHPPAAADREGAVTLRQEEDEDEDGPIEIAAEEALRDPDIDIETGVDAEPYNAEAWTPVTDGAEKDIGLLDFSEPSASERWAAVKDAESQDVELAPLEDEERGDPWGAISEAPPPEPEPPAASAPLSLPTVPLPTATTPAPRAPVVPRVLPWRSIVTPVAPEMGRTLLTTDVTRDRCTLLVSSWSWIESDGEPILHFRLADDAAAITVRSEAADRPVVRCTLSLGNVPVEVVLDVETTREGVGIVLGREALAGRFLVDPGREALDPK